MSVRRVYVLGEVKNLGAFQIPPGINPTVFDAVALAGGFTDNADLTQVRVFRVEKFSRLVGVKPSGIELRDWRRKWGLCRADRGTLRFNWRLVQLPEELVDYIVVHELVHLKHPGHGKEFWDCMSKILPNYHRRKERLKEWISALLW